MKIEKIKIRNFKVFKNIEIRDLPNMCVFLGANGVGKTTLFDVFGFLSSALRNNVKYALNQRGGFKEVISRDSEGDIEFEITFKDTSIFKSRLLVYEISVGLSVSKHPIVKREELYYESNSFAERYENQLLNFTNGTGYIVNSYSSAKKERDKKHIITLDSYDTLAIKGWGQFSHLKEISAVRRVLEDWFIFDFQNNAQSVDYTNIIGQLSASGSNLAQVTKHIYDTHPDIFQTILRKMTQKIPGVSHIEAEETKDGRIILQFKDGSFKDPFIARYVSDGTIKMFAYLVLLNDPTPHPLLCVEEPENYLHPELLAELAEEFREYADKGGQVFISTHSPDFVNSLDVKELFWLNKQHGYTTIQSAKDDDTIKNLVKEGDLLGALWKQGYLKGSGPKN